MASLVIDLFKALKSEYVTDVVQYQVRNYTRRVTQNDLTYK